jgi:glycosyltransferase involved in cell wall biosynthesis
MTKYPKISIITPVYNSIEYLEETINSVLSQNYPNLEYIIIDGGSTDGSVELIKKYSHHLHYWISEKDTGMYDALQKGFKVATGEISGWINSDDLLIRNSLFAISNIFSNFTEVNWLNGVEVTTCENGFIKPREIKRWSKYHFYNKDYKFIQQESTFWRSSLLQKVDLEIKWKDVKYAGDFILWLNFFKHEKLYSCNLSLGAFRIRSGKNQLSVKFFNEYLQECENALNEEIKNLDKKTSLNSKIFKLLNYSRLKYIFKKSSKIRRNFELNDYIIYVPTKKTFEFVKNL